MSPFAERILALLIAHAGSAGNSPYSFEVMPECGTDPMRPACKIERVCDRAQDFRCAAPRWSAVRGAWVRNERRETAIKRFGAIAESISRTAMLQVRCRGGDDWSVVEECTPIGWSEGPESLALVAATTAIWESGLREDIEFGHAPNGRGPDQESCLMQAMPNQIAQFATWLPREERERLMTKGKAAEHEALAQTLLGDRPEALDRCFTVGMRALARSRKFCARQPGIHWTNKMWSLYGTGNSCSYIAASAEKDFPAKRARTYARMRSEYGKLRLDQETRILLGLVSPNEETQAISQR